MDSLYLEQISVEGGIRNKINFKSVFVNKLEETHFKTEFSQSTENTLPRVSKFASEICDLSVISEEKYKNMNNSDNFNQHFNTFSEHIEKIVSSASQACDIEPHYLVENFQYENLQCQTNTQSHGYDQDSHNSDESLGILSSAILDNTFENLLLCDKVLADGINDVHNTNNMIKKLSEKDLMYISNDRNYMNSEFSDSCVQGISENSCANAHSPIFASTPKHETNFEDVFEDIQNSAHVYLPNSKLEPILQSSIEDVECDIIVNSSKLRKVEDVLEEDWKYKVNRCLNDTYTNLKGVSNQNDIADSHVDFNSCKLESYKKNQSILNSTFIINSEDLNDGTRNILNETLIVSIKPQSEPNFEKNESGSVLNKTMVKHIIENECDLTVDKYSIEKDFDVNVTYSKENLSFINMDDTILESNHKSTVNSKICDQTIDILNTTFDVVNTELQNTEKDFNVNITDSKKNHFSFINTDDTILESNLKSTVNSKICETIDILNTTFDVVNTELQNPEKDFNVNVTDSKKNHFSFINTDDTILKKSTVNSKICDQAIDNLNATFEIVNAELLKDSKENILPVQQFDTATKNNLKPGTSRISVNETNSKSAAAKFISHIKPKTLRKSIAAFSDSHLPKVDVNKNGQRCSLSSYPIALKKELPEMKVSTSKNILQHSVKQSTKRNSISTVGRISVLNNFLTGSKANSYGDPKIGKCSSKLVLQKNIAEKKLLNENINISPKLLPEEKSVVRKFRNSISVMPRHQELKKTVVKNHRKSMSPIEKGISNNLNSSYVLNISKIKDCKVIGPTKLKEIEKLNGISSCNSSRDSSASTMEEKKGKSKTCEKTNLSQKLNWLIKSSSVNPNKKTSNCTKMLHDSTKAYQSSSTRKPLNENALNKTLILSGSSGSKQASGVSKKTCLRSFTSKPLNENAENISPILTKSKISKQDTPVSKKACQNAFTRKPLNGNALNYCCGSKGTKQAVAVSISKKNQQSLSRIPSIRHPRTTYNNCDNSQPTTSICNQENEDGKCQKMNLRSMSSVCKTKTSQLPLRKK